MAHAHAARSVDWRAVVLPLHRHRSGDGAVGLQPVDGEPGCLGGGCGLVGEHLLGQLHRGPDCAGICGGPVRSGCPAADEPCRVGVRRSDAVVEPGRVDRAVRAGCTGALIRLHLPGDAAGDAAAHRGEARGQRHRLSERGGLAGGGGPARAGGRSRAGFKSGDRRTVRLRWGDSHLHPARDLSSARRKAHHTGYIFAAAIEKC